MDDISAMLNQFLSNEENVKQLSELASSMGLGGQNSQNNNSSEKNDNAQNNLSGLMQLLGSSASDNKKAEQPPSETPNMPDINQIMKLQKIFSSFSKEDENILLLKALRPHLQEKNRKKVDDAIKIMQLISVLPMIKETGLFGGDLF